MTVVEQANLSQADSVDGGISMKEVRRIRDILQDDGRINKLPDHLLRLMKKGKGTHVEVMINPVLEIHGRGILKPTTSPGERNLSGLDVVYEAYSGLRKKRFIVRIPLTRIRMDQIRVVGEEFAATPKGRMMESYVQISEPDEAEGLDKADMTWMRSGFVVKTDELGEEEVVPAQVDEEDVEPKNKRGRPMKQGRPAMDSGD